MARLSLTAQAQQIIATRVSNGDAVIDATLGNGHDALFLAQCVGADGVVFGFDVQTQAIANTQQLLSQLEDQASTQCLLASHADMLQWIPDTFHGRIKAIMFNLGYLPGGDKSCITQVDSTIPGLNAALYLLAPGGVLTVMVYPGHSGGDVESEAVRQWLNQLDPNRYSVECMLSQSEKNTAPRLFVIDKRADLL